MSNDRELLAWAASTLSREMGNGTVGEVRFKLNEEGITKAVVEETVSAGDFMSALRTRLSGRITGDIKVQAHEGTIQRLKVERTERPPKREREEE